MFIHLCIHNNIYMSSRGVDSMYLYLEGYIPSWGSFALEGIFFRRKRSIIVF